MKFGDTGVTMGAPGLKCRADPKFDFGINVAFGTIVVHMWDFIRMMDRFHP